MSHADVLFKLEQATSTTIETLREHLDRLEVMLLPGMEASPPKKSRGTRKPG